MPSSPPVLRPSSPSSSSSSDFAIQAVTTADGVRKPTAEEKPPSKQPSATLNGLVPYADASSSSSDEHRTPLPTNPNRPKKRVRFSDQHEPNKRIRTDNDDDTAMVEGADLSSQDEQLDEEAALVAELAHFEAVVADIGRDNDAVTADLLDAEDMREQATQTQLEQRVKSLRQRLRHAESSPLQKRTDLSMSNVNAGHNQHEDDHNGDLHLDADLVDDHIQIKGVLRARRKAKGPP